MGDGHGEGLGGLGVVVGDEGDGVVGLGLDEGGVEDGAEVGLVAGGDAGEVADEGRVEEAELVFHLGEVGG